MNEEKLDRIIQLLENLNKNFEIREKFNEEKTLRDIQTPETKESPRELFLRYSPKKDTDKTLVVLHFLELNGVLQITIKQISEGFSEMREDIPKNIADKIQLLDKRGFLIKSLEKREGLNCWNISQSGKKYLEKIKNGS